MNQTIKEAADRFITEETQFHLGFLPSEQSNPKTKDLEQAYLSDPMRGVRCLQTADRDVLVMLTKIYCSKEYKKFTEWGLKTVKNGGRIIFSGCGATGRLSILLESMWRTCCARNPEAAPYADRVESIMTGGDFAMIKAVEFFEDYSAFGRKQVQEAGMTADDMLVAITEGGETSSVLGTLYEAADRGCAVFLLFNNPADILCEHLERSRIAIQDPRVTVLDLYCGPMALAGSTRMQATTAEQMVAGGMLETVMHTLLCKKIPDYTASFDKLLTSLESAETVKAIADYTVREASVYSNHGKVTYFVNDFMLDIFTDTTERSPTFMLPPFRPAGDHAHPAPWTLVRNPLFPTDETWNRALHRRLRCLSWQKQDYENMGAAKQVCERPPEISVTEILKIHVGNEDISERCENAEDTAVLISFDEPEENFFKAFSVLAKPFRNVHTFGFNTKKCSFNVPVECEDGALELMRHLAVKLVMNTISTGAMTLLGRVSGNWMSWVNCTNKKLIDRGVRLLVELAGTDYRTACEALFEAREEQKKSGKEAARSPVQIALARLRGKAE